MSVRKLKNLIRWRRKLIPALLAVPIVLVIRALRPWCLIRIGWLVGERIGHFGLNTEVYLCERNERINSPAGRYVDLFFINGRESNAQLARMWRRVLRIWPRWVLAPLLWANHILPGGEQHEVGYNTQSDRDVHNLLDKYPPHLSFTQDEEATGEACLRDMGIPPGNRFVCLLVRDSAYLDAVERRDWSYHNYRDSDIRNYIYCAEQLADYGYYVIRMGAKVSSPMGVDHPKIIDYAANGMRSDFMDIYLGAKCEFCISTSSGWDAVPQIFRRPIVYVNMVPLDRFITYSGRFIGITKHHVKRDERRELTAKEIFDYGACFSKAEDYRLKGIELVENSPKEVTEVVMEMARRLDGTWNAEAQDESLQEHFWKLFPSNARHPKNNKPLHGDIRSRYGAEFLRNNPEWLGVD